MKKKSQTTSIYITETDHQRLSGLIETTRERNGVDREYLKNCGGGVGSSRDC